MGGGRCGQRAAPSRSARWRWPVRASWIAAGQVAAAAWAPLAAVAGLAWAGYLIALLVYRRADRAAARRRALWLLAAAALVVGVCVVLPTLHLMTGAPERPALWIVYALVLFPLAHSLAVSVTADVGRSCRITESLLLRALRCWWRRSISSSSSASAARPKGHERDVLLASLAAAVAVALLARPVRRRLATVSDAVIGERVPSTEEVANAFVGRMSRAVPMDELLLQLAESLRATVPGTVAEIWTGSDGHVSPGP